MAYFELSCDDDGSVAIRRVDIRQYIESLNRSGGKVNFVDTLELDQYVDPTYWNPTTILLIKGEIVVPKPVQVATKYEVDQ